LLGVAIQSDWVYCKEASVFTIEIGMLGFWMPPRFQRLCTTKHCQIFSENYGVYPTETNATQSILFRFPQLQNLQRLTAGNGEHGADMEHGADIEHGAGMEHGADMEHELFVWQRDEVFVWQRRARGGAPITHPSAVKIGISGTSGPELRL
jgi:hypothetical protein